MTVFEVLTIFLSALTLLTTIALIFISRSLSKIDKQSTQKEARDIMVLKGLKTSNELGVETARALVTQEWDGPLTTALENSEKYKTELDCYLINQAGRRI